MTDFQKPLPLEKIVATAYAAKWAYMAETVNRLLRPLVTLVIARILIPEDYGVIALSVSILSTVSLIWSLGLPTALIQRRDNDLDQAANVTFWINGSLAILVYVGIIAGRNIFGQIFREPRIAQILPLMALSSLMDGLSVVQNALLQKRMAFSQLFWRATLPSAVPLLVTLPLAFLGYGYWALAWGTVIGSFVGNLTLWLTNRWYPSFRFNFRIAREMIRFGIPTLGETFQGWMEQQADRIMIGIFFSVREVGIYSLGVTLFSMFYGFIFSPIKTVGYSSLCQVVDKPQEQMRLFLRAQKMVALLALPIGVGLASIAPLVEKTVFAARYTGLAVVLSGLALYYIASASQSLIAPLFRAAGFPSYMFWLNITVIGLIVILYPISAQLGLQTFLLARGLISIFIGGLAVWFTQRFLGIKWVEQIKVFIIPLIASVCMGLSVLFLEKRILAVDGWMAWGMLLVVISIGAGIYISIINWLDPKSFIVVWSFLSPGSNRQKTGG